MTSPVLQEENPPLWNIRFIMPSTYAYNEIPKAKNKSVTLKKIKSPMFVSIKFSGDPKEQKLRKKTDEIKAFIREKKLNVLPKPIYAFYNPPWTLPILRRNEIWYELRNL
ncbi:MAG: heme-binding protein [Chlamydiae bacterium]|nr:heme-binding protein [Chlamydiota bacterium]